MSSQPRNYLRRCEVLAFDGLPWRGKLFGIPDGRRYVGFSRDNEDGLSGDKALRLVYRLGSEGMSFLGMFVGKLIRGRNIGERLVEYFFMNGMGEDRDFLPTGRIHKPGIALSLARVGLQAVTPGWTVRILPRQESDSGPPKIHVLAQDPSCGKRNIVPGSSVYGPFYEMVPPDQAPQLPVGNPDMQVVIHARYDVV